jgi:hypothetical protein
MTDIWNRLISHRQAQGDLRIDALFAADAGRARNFSTAADGLVLDWSKTSIDAPALALLKQDLSQAGQVGLLNDLTGFEADLAAYAAQPDMSEGALEALALAR